MRRLLGAVVRFARRHTALSVSAVVAGLALAVFVVVWFEPHKLFLDDRVDEALPGAEAAAASEPSPTAATPSPDAPAATAASPAGPTVLSRARFRPLEHAVVGEALVLEAADGGRFVRFEDLDVSNGPDLKVYLSVLPPDRGWYDYDDDEYVSLGDLKGNIGDQNYRLPADLDLSRFKSVVIWCERFSVGFAVAGLSV